MTATAAPAGRVRSPCGTGLAWTAWRQHRVTVTGLLVLFAACAAVMGITGLRTHAVYASYLAHHCLTARLPLCHPRLLDEMHDESQLAGYVPWLAGVFVGAPLLAREFETGTYRFSFTQSVSGRRQILTALLLAAALVVVCGCLLGLLATWAANPLHRIALGYDTGLSYWDPGYFWLTAVTLPALSLLDLSLGVLAGVLIRRAVPAIAAALAGALLVAALVTGFGASGAGPDGAGPVYRAMLGIAPLTARPLPTTGPPGSFLLSWRYVGADGRNVPGRILYRIIPSREWAHPAALRTALAAHRISYLVTYQPASRYWLFQAAAAAILVVLAMAMGYAAIRLACRRR